MLTGNTNDLSHELRLYSSILLSGLGVIDTECFQRFRGEEHSAFLSGKFCIGFLSLDMFGILDNGTYQCDTSYGISTHKLRYSQTISVGRIVF